MLLIMLVIDTMAVPSGLHTLHGPDAPGQSASIRFRPQHPFPVEEICLETTRWVNIPRASAISAAFTRRTSYAGCPGKSPTGPSAGRQATSTSLTVRGVRGYQQGFTDHRPSARLSAASSFGSPPVIIMREKFPFLPEYRADPPLHHPHQLRQRLFIHILQSLSFLNQFIASANGGRLTPEPGFTLILFTKARDSQNNQPAARMSFRLRNK